MIILMGLAGSGKSTQGQILAQERGGIWLSAGQVLRDTPYEVVHEIQRDGELVDDRLTIPLMAEVIAKNLNEGREIILDGYPRTAEQAEWIRDNIANQVLAVVRIIVPKEELSQRLLARGREDDMSREAIEERFKIVEQNIYTVCAILAEKNIPMLDIDGVGTVEEVAMRVRRALEDVQRSQPVENSEQSLNNRGENE